MVTIPGTGLGEIGVIKTASELVLEGLKFVYDLYKRSRKKGGYLIRGKEIFPYDLVAIKEIPKKLRISSSLHGNLEEYVPRKALEKELGEDLVPQSRKILIYGSEGVGKSREAFEIIKRLNDDKPRNVYLGVNQEVVVPTKHPSERDVVLFIDDLVMPETHYGKDGEKIREHTLSQSIQKCIQVFEGVEVVDVIFTLRSDRYQAVKGELSDVLEYYNFKIIKLDALSTSEKADYIKNLVKKFEFPLLTDDCIKALIKASRDSLEEIYEFFKLKKDEKKPSIEEKDLEEGFRKYVKRRRSDKYRELSKNEKIVLNALSNLERFSVPCATYLVIKLSKSISKYQEAPKRSKPDSEDKFANAIKKLKKRKIIEIIEDKIESDEYFLQLAYEDAQFQNDPLLVIQIIDSISKEKMLPRSLLKVCSLLGVSKIHPLFKKLKYRKELYLILTPFTEALYKNGRYKEANRFQDHIINLPDKYLPDPKKVRSDVLFHKGYAYYSQGRKYWNNAKDCYRESLKLDDQNLFAKHALATLYRRQNKLSKALSLLNEIIEANEEDILAYRTKLEIQMDADIGLKEAKETYIDIEKILENETHLFTTDILSLKFVCARFLAKEGESLRGKEAEKAEKKIQEAKELFENIINEIPSEEHNFETIVRNAYGCFLYDTIDKEQGITQLVKAHEVWPKHNHTRHKLATAYIEKGRNLKGKESLHYFEKAKNYLEEILDSDPDYYAAKRALADLEGKIIDWDKLAESVERGELMESEFWGKVSNIYNKYQDALLKPNGGKLHNAIVHSNTGFFLSHIESVVHKKNYLKNIPSEIPSADIELLKGIEIEKHFKENPRRSVGKHLIRTYFAIGDYFHKKAIFEREEISKGLSRKGKGFLFKGMSLSAELGEPITYPFANSYAESYLAKMLYDNGKPEEAKEHLKNAVEKYGKNGRALWLLARIHEEDNELEEAIKCYKKKAAIKKGARDESILKKKIRNFGIALYREGEYEKALPFLEEARANKDLNISEGIDLMECYVAVNEYEKAEEFYQELCSSLDDDYADNEKEILKEHASRLGIKHI